MEGEMTHQKIIDKDLQNRILKFSADVDSFLKNIKKDEQKNVIREISTQLLISSNACCTDFEEALNVNNKPEYNKKMEIAFKEMKDNNYWLKMLELMEEGNSLICKELINESGELQNILESLYLKSLKKK